MPSTFLEFLLLLKEGGGFQCNILSHVHPYSHVLHPAYGAAFAYRDYECICPLFVFRLGLNLR